MKFAYDYRLGEDDRLIFVCDNSPPLRERADILDALPTWMHGCHPRLSVLAYRSERDPASKAPRRDGSHHTADPALVFQDQVDAHGKKVVSEWYDDCRGWGEDVCRKCVGIVFEEVSQLHQPHQA